MINKASAAGGGTGCEFDRPAVNIFPRVDGGQALRPPPRGRRISRHANNHWVFFLLPNTSGHRIGLCAIFLGKETGKARDSVYMEHIQIPDEQYWL